MVASVNSSTSCVCTIVVVIESGNMHWSKYYTWGVRGTRNERQWFQRLLSPPLRPELENFETWEHGTFSCCFLPANGTVRWGKMGPGHFRLGGPSSGAAGDPPLYGWVSLKGLKALKGFKSLEVKVMKSHTTSCHVMVHIIWHRVILLAVTHHVTIRQARWGI